MSTDNNQVCEECEKEAVSGWDYCEEHLEYYFCECGRELEMPGDGLCRRCD